MSLQLAAPSSTLNANNTRNNETGWGSGLASDTRPPGGSGGGISAYEPQPAYQNGIVTQSEDMRTVPDVAMDAAGPSGAAVYDSYSGGIADPWYDMYGTSLAAPMWAGLIAIADQGRALQGLAPLDGPTQTLPAIYSLPASDFHDITVGNNGYEAGPGYDLVTGRGSPIANLLVPNLVDYGVFKPSASYSAGGTFSSAIGSGDFTGNGRQDLLVTTFSTDSVNLLLNNGNGTFQAPIAIKDPGSGPWCFAVGDFLGNGKEDFVVGNYYSGDICVYLGNGNGTFQAPVTYALPSAEPYSKVDSAFSIAVGNFGNGHLDLAVADYNAFEVSIFLGDGTGKFKLSSNCPVEGNPVSIAVGDFKGNGILDLAVANEYGYNDDNGHNTISILLGNGNGTFTNPLIPTAASPRKGIGVGEYPRGIAVGDFGNGHLDIAVTLTGSNQVAVLLGNGNGTFQAPVDYAVGSQPFGVAVGDFTDNGKQDLVVANSDDTLTNPTAPGTVSLLMGYGNGKFAPAYNYSVDWGPTQIIVADFTGNSNYPDVAVACRGKPPAWDGSACVLLNAELNAGGGGVAPAGSVLMGSGNNGPASLAGLVLNGNNNSLFPASPANNEGNPVNSLLDSPAQALLPAALQEQAPNAQAAGHETLFASLAHINGTDIDQDLIGTMDLATMLALGLP